MLKHSGRSLVDSAKVLGGAKKWWGKFNFKHGLSLATKHEVSVRHMLEGWHGRRFAAFEVSEAQTTFCVYHDISYKVSNYQLFDTSLQLQQFLPAQQNQRTMVKNGQNQSAASAAQIQHSLEA